MIKYSVKINSDAFLKKMNCDENILIHLFKTQEDSISGYSFDIHSTAIYRNCNNYINTHSYNLAEFCLSISHNFICLMKFQDG